MVSLSSGLLQFASNAYLIAPTSSGTSASIDQNHMQLLALVNQQPAVSSGKPASSTAASAQLAEDTYTPSAGSQVAQSSSTSSSNSQSSAASAASSSQGSQGDTVTLASLIKNQTISGSADATQILWSAAEPLMTVDPEATAWNDLTDKVNSGDYSGAQAALADYSTALVNSHIGTWADITPIQNDLTALGSALKTGDASDVGTAFTSLSAIAPTHNLGLVLPTGGGSDVASESGQMSWFATNLASALQTLGYTASNATAKANTLVLGYAADMATIHAVAVGAPSDAISDQTAAEQSITDLGKATAQSTDTNMLSNIIASMAQATSVSAMESTLTQLDSKYGTAAQGTLSNSSMSSTHGCSHSRARIRGPGRKKSRPLRLACNSRQLPALPFVSCPFENSI